MSDVWICSNCGNAVPTVDWFDHREDHLNEHDRRAS